MAYRILVTDLINDTGLELLRSAEGVEVDIIQNLSAADLLEGVWERRIFLGMQLAGKTLGIIGMGRIGRLVAARARAFDMHVIAFDPYVPEEVADSLRVELVED